MYLPGAYMGVLLKSQDGTCPSPGPVVVYPKTVGVAQHRKRLPLGRYSGAGVQSHAAHQDSPLRQLGLPTLLWALLKGFGFGQSYFCIAPG